MRYTVKNKYEQVAVHCEERGRYRLAARIWESAARSAKGLRREWYMSNAATCRKVGGR